MESEGTLTLSQSPPCVPLLQQTNIVHTPHSISARPILILSPHLRLVLRSLLYTYGFPTHNICSCSPGFMLYGMPISIILTWSCYLLFVKSTSYEALHHTIFSTFPWLHPSLIQIFSSAPWSQTPQVYFPLLSVRNHVFHPYRTRAKIIALYILIFTFFDRRWEDKRFCIEW
jgi:hypothetical protein